VNACTIVSRRELARARVLVSTFREHHPDPNLKFTVLLLDGIVGADTVDGAEVRLLEELQGTSQGLLVAGNPRAALPMAVLPHLLRSLLDEEADGVTYLALGLRVLGPLIELEHLLARHEVVLAARAAPGRPLNEPVFAGRYGGGAVSRQLLAIKDGASAVRLLESWPRWFRNAGQAVDAWFDGLPVIATDAAVLREPGYGLDPWTLAEWGANGRRDVLEVAGRSARLFDFSALDPLEPGRLCDSEDTIELSTVPALAGLCERQARELLQAGYAEDMQRPEHLESLGDGVRMTKTTRRLLAEAVQDGAVSQSPFTEDGRQAFYAYLNEPADRGRAVALTRLHLAIWHDNPALQVAYPHLDGPDGAGYAGWLCVHGPAEEGLAEPLLPPAPAHIYRDAAPNLHERAPLWGVNVAGFFTSELGLGEAARLLIAGLDACGVPALPVQAQLVPPCRQGAEFTYTDPDAAPYPINVVCMNGDTIAPFAREVGRSFFEGRHTIALWWWEVGVFPVGWEAAFEHIDELWVASRHIYDAIAPASPVPVVQVTMPVIMPRVSPRGRAELGLPEDGFLFLFVHDYHSVAARKNPVGLIEAFKRAFPPGTAKLVVKSINAENLPHEHDRVMLAAGEHQDITLIDSYVSVADKNAMIAACDCYVSLHRSEGFGLTVAEAMLLSKPVIATRYGGTLEFMTDANSYLVDWQPVKVGEGAQPYPADGIWADPDLDQAATLMREVLADPERARERGEAGRRYMLEHHAPRIAGESMRARLRTIHDRRVRDGERALNLAHLPALELDELGELIYDSHPLEDFENHPRVKRALLRRGVALTRPLFIQQRAVNLMLKDRLARADVRLHEVSETLEHQQEARFAELLALVRKLRAELRDTRAELGHARAELSAIERVEPGLRLDALEELGREFEQHLAEHRATPYINEEREFEAWSDPTVGSVIGYRAATGGSSEGRAYFDFEATFRGPESRVRDTQRAYLPLLAGRAPVLDVGCGRAELLDLLREEQIAAGGVDSDAGMVAHARAKGHEVALDDGNEHLRRLEPGSLGAIVAMEVVEHLPYESLTEFLALARSRLREDGLLIFETVNPHAVHAMKAFWVDPTHQRPILPEAALELCRLSGFGEAFWFHPTGTGQFEADRNSQPIYAIVARAGSAGARG
jgi:glycosyltransferase involved in cell wall biosynthesis/2-polyprenyl-3-methyl-5-hydroxy-6-metoxy-1,4-benzoquinol methylase